MPELKKKKFGIRPATGKDRTFFNILILGYYLLRIIIIKSDLRANSRPKMPSAGARIVRSEPSTLEHSFVSTAFILYYNIRFPHRIHRVFPLDFEI